MLTNSSIVEDLGIPAVWVLAAQLPDIKERLPVDIRSQPWYVVVLQHPAAEKCRCNLTHKHTSCYTTASEVLTSENSQVVILSINQVLRPNLSISTVNDSFTWTVSTTLHSTSDDQTIWHLRCNYTLNMKTFSILKAPTIEHSVTRDNNGMCLS